MTDDWSDATLGEHVDLLMGFPFKSSQYVNDPDCTRLLRGDNIVQGRLRWAGVKRWPPGLITAEVNRYQLRAGDVVLAMDRPWIEAGLKYATLAEDDLPALLVQRVARLRATETLDQRYLKYLIGSRAFTQHILAVQTGTSVPHISGAQIRDFEFTRPPMPAQTAIGRLLGSLDERVAENERAASTLIQLARSLFRAMFVSQELGSWENARLRALLPASTFDYSNISANWDLGALRETCELERVAVDPGETPNAEFMHYSIPAFDAAGAPIRERGASIKSIKYRVPEESILTSKLNPEVPRVWWPEAVVKGAEAVCSTEFLVLRPKPNWPREFLYCLLQDPDTRDAMAGLVTGTSKSHQRVQPDDLLELAVPMPDAGAAGAFAEITRPMLEMARTLRAQGRALNRLLRIMAEELLTGSLELPEATLTVREVLGK